MYYHELQYYTWFVGDELRSPATFMINNFFYHETIAGEHSSPLRSQIIPRNL